MTNDETALVLAGGMSADEALELLIGILNRQGVSREAARQAIKSTLEQYEYQFITVCVALAKSRLSRTAKLMAALGKLEEETFTPERIERASTHELINLIRLARTGFGQDMETIHKVIEMQSRLKALQGIGRGGTLPDIVGSEDSSFDEEILSELAPKSRAKIRKIIGKIMGVVSEDTDDG